MLKRVFLWMWLFPAAAFASGYEWTVPDMIQAVEMPGVMQANNIPVAIKAAVSKRSIYALQDYYLQEFKHAGLYVAPYEQQTHSTRDPELTGLDVDTKISYTVILQANKDGSTTVIMGTADVSDWPKKTAPDDFAPLPPDAVQPSRVRTEGRQLMIFSTSRSEKDVYDFYAKALGEAGYKPDSDGRYVRRDGWITVSAHADKKVTYVNLTHGSDPQK